MRRKPTHLKAALPALLCLLLSHTETAQAQMLTQERGSWPQNAPVPFSFALIGDLPYEEADLVKFDRLIDDINQDPSVRWVVHTGDIKSGSSPCSEVLFSERLQTYQHFQRAFIYTPGDNEWTDCHRATAGGYAPLERLQVIRRMFFAQPGRSLGQHPITVQSQAQDPQYPEFVENLRWQRAGVVFATLHVVGSNNALAPFATRTAADDAEVARRTQADLAWLRQSFEVARQRNAKGIFFAMQADPAFEAKPGSPERQGFDALLLELERQTIAFGRPVLLAHGDSHYFRLDKPLKGTVDGRLLENFTRVENFGERDVHWVKITVNPLSAEVFSVQQEIIAENLETHPAP